jgi:hypothetical protein
MIAMRAKAASHWRIVPKRETIRRLGRERLDADTDNILAYKLQLAPSTLSVMLSGQTQMTGPVIALFISTLDSSFDELFAIEQIQPAVLADAA